MEWRNDHRIISGFDVGHFDGNKNKPAALILILTCNAHVIRRIAKTIENDNQFKKLKAIRTFLLECAGLIIMSKTIQELDNVFDDILNVILKRNEKEASYAITLLSGIQAKSKGEIQGLMEDALNNDKILEIEEEFYDVHKSSTTVCENSKFYQRYWKNLSLKMTCMDDDSEAPKTNQYYAFNFATYLLKTFLPYVPLVTGVMLPFVNKNISRVINVYSESHMRVYKKNISPYEHNNSIGELVRAVANYSSMVVAEEKLNIGAKSKISVTQNPLYPEAASDPFIT